MESVDLTSIEILRQILDYDQSTGEFFWTPRVPEMFSSQRFTNERACRVWNTRYAGKRTFTNNNGRGYLTARIGGVQFSAHRTAWAMHHGEWPAGLIDHINGDRHDNRIDNLRVVTTAENTKNSARSRNNTSGCTGVSFRKRSVRQKPWRAYIKVDRKLVELGQFWTKTEAIAARKEAERRYGFHPNHGRVSLR